MTGGTGGRVTSDTGGHTVGGVGAGDGSGGTSGVTGTSPDVTRAYQYRACGRIPATPPNAGALYAPDGTLVVRRDSLTFLSSVDFSVVRELANISGEVAFPPSGDVFAEQEPSGIALRALSDGAVQRRLPTADERCPRDNLRFSFTGDRLLTFGEDGLCAFLVADGSLLLHRPEAVTDAGFSDDRILTTERHPNNPSSPELLVYDLSSGESSRIMTEALASPPIAASKAVISPDGSAVAGLVRSADEYRVALWSSDDGHLLWDNSVKSAFDPLFSLRGEFVLTADAVIRAKDGSLAWQVRWPLPLDGKLVALSPDGQQLATELGQHLALVNASGGLPRFLGTHTKNTAGVGAHLLRSLALSADGRTLVSVGEETLRWKLAERFEDSVPSYVAGGVYMSRAQLDPEARWVTLAGDGRTISSLEGPDRVSFQTPLSQGKSLPANPCVWLQFRFSRDSSFLLSTTYDYGLEVFRVAELHDFAERSAAAVPVFRFDDFSCDTFSLSQDGSRILLSRGDSLDASALPTLGGALTSSDELRTPLDDDVLSPDGSDRVVSSGCQQVFDDLGETHSCRTELRSTRFGNRIIPELTAPFPSFSPEGHWLAAGPTLMHLPSRETVVVDPNARVSVFTPEGDVIAGERDGSLARFCRTP